MNGVGISFTPLFFTSIIIALFVSAAQTSFALLDWRLVLLLHKVICSSVHRMNVPQYPESKFFLFLNKASQRAEILNPPI